MYKETLLAGVLLAGLAVSTPAYAGWGGDTIQGDDAADVPPFGFIWGGGYATTTVPGTEFPGGGSYAVTLGAHDISLSTPFATGYGTFPFNGLVLTDLSNDPGIVGVTMLTNSGSAFPGLSWNSSNIFFDFSGLETGNNQTWTFHVAFADDPAPAPEPASWAMMIGGLGLVGAAMRRARTRVRFA